MTTPFEEFLQTKHIEARPQLLDDDIPDNYNDWVSTLEYEDWVDLGNEFGGKV